MTNLHVSNDDGLWIVTDRESHKWWSVSSDLTRVMNSAMRELKTGSVLHTKLVNAVRHTIDAA